MNIDFGALRDRKRGRHVPFETRRRLFKNNRLAVHDERNRSSYDLSVVPISNRIVAEPWELIGIVE